MQKKNMSVIALTLVLSVLVGLLAVPRVSAAAAPSLFWQDEAWYRDKTAYLEIINGIYYVPVDFFAMISRIEVSIDAPRGEFMLYNRVTKEYISVLYKEKIATVNGEEEIYLNLYKLHGGYYYVPAEEFAAILSLSCEVVPSSAAQGVSLRLSDGTQTKTFAELLALYDAPTESTDTTTETDSDTTVPPPPVTSGGDTAAREVYLTFNTVSAENFPAMLTALETAGVHAAFFFTEEEMRKQPELVIAAFAAGHTVALAADEADGADALLVQAERVNAYLYSLLKTTTRILQAQGGTTRAGLTEADIDALTAAGYVLWDWSYDVPDSVGYGAAYVESLVRTQIRTSRVHVLRMSTNDTVVRILPKILAFLGENPNCQIKQIRASGEEIHFSPAQ